jgi:Protein of unknown function (DUF2867)
MGISRSLRAHRVAIVEETDPLGRSDYASAFRVPRQAADTRSAEQWARAAFEGAPAVLSAFVVAGWRYGLGFRLGPRASRAHVLGWKITGNAPDAVVLDLQSALLTAKKVVRVEGDRVVMTTFVRYERRPARLLWSAVTPIHHRTEPFLLGRAASSN